MSLPPKITVAKMSRIQKAKGGGVATIYSNNLSISQKYNSFEVMVLRITLSRETRVSDKSPVTFVLASLLIVEIIL